MRLLVLAKGDLRHLFPPVARRLAQDSGHEVSAVAFNAAAGRALEATGAFAKVHCLSSSLRAFDAEAGSDKVAGLLERLQGLSHGEALNQLIHSDRLLREYPYELALRLVCGVYDFWTTIFERERPEAIVGEVATAAEWLGWLMATDLNVPYLIPYLTPVTDRFYFLRDPHGTWAPMEARYRELCASGLSPRQEAEASQFLDTFRKTRQKPGFLAASQRSPVVAEAASLRERLGRVPFRVKVFLEDGRYELGSYHGTSPWFSVRAHAARIGRHWVVEARYFEDEVPSGRYVYFPLHVQPEYTVDVRAPFVSNQVALIENLARSVPLGYRVVVKEHPAGAGDRPLEFYRQLRSLYNVWLASPRVDSHRLIENAALVATITGTAAWEAVLYEKPVIAFGPLCYGFCEQIVKSDGGAGLPELIQKAIRDFKPDRRAVLSLVSALLESAYMGFLADPLIYPEVLEAGNVLKLARAIDLELARPPGPGASEAG